MMQVGGDRNATPPAPPVWEKEIVSPEIDPMARVTVAVHSETAATAKDEGVQETAVVVVALFTATVVKPELPALFVSPE
jgi:hypothetical protein